MNNILKRGLRFTLKTSFFKFLLIKALKEKKSRDALNQMYNKLGYKSKSQVHFLLSKFFTNQQIKFKDALWKINFNNKVLSLPLAEKNLWLDWDQALSILGHDITIKETYEDLIKQKKLACIFDIGANYGTHSLLFLSQGIKTVTFEPNPNCRAVFSKLLETNNLKGIIVPNAVGEADYETELYFPEKNTWLGTLSEKIKVDLENKFDLIKVKTKVISLDSYLKENDFVPDLIKIDTEGYELQVLNGAINTINKFKPMIVFEENEGYEQRVKIVDFLESLGYSIYKLPFLETRKIQIDRKEFLESKETNFISVFQSGTSTMK
ncbi:MAG: FkbM family methyltransferase [Flavitalea sp.]